MFFGHDFEKHFKVFMNSLISARIAQAFVQSRRAFDISEENCHAFDLERFVLRQNVSIKKLSKCRAESRNQDPSLHGRHRVWPAPASAEEKGEHWDG